MFCFQAGTSSSYTYTVEFLKQNKGLCIWYVSMCLFWLIAFSLLRTIFSIDFVIWLFIRCPICVISRTAKMSFVLQVKLFMQLSEAIRTAFSSLVFVLLGWTLAFLFLKILRKFKSIFSNIHILEAQSQLNIIFWCPILYMDFWRVSPFFFLFCPAMHFLPSYMCTFSRKLKKLSNNWLTSNFM